MSDQEPWWKVLIKKASVATLTAGIVILVVVVTADENLRYMIAGSAATYLWGKLQGG